MDFELEKTVDAVSKVQTMLNCTQEQAVEVTMYSLTAGCSITTAYAALYGDHGQVTELFVQARIWA